MERLIELTNEGTITIHPEIAGIKAYSDIWERDNSKGKHIAIKELSYIWYLCSMDKRNPYKEYVDPKDRELRIITDVFGEGTSWKPDKLLVLAKSQFIKNNYTFNAQYLKSALSAAEKTKGYFDNVDYDEVSPTGTYKYKVKEVISALKETSNIIFL